MAPGRFANTLSARQTRILMACSIGAAFGYGTLGVAVFGQFVLPLSRALDAAPADVGLAFTAMTLGSVLGPPLAGGLIDRFGARTVVVRSAALMALAFLGLSYAPDLPTLCLTYFAVALLGSGTLATAYSRPIVAAFEERRGAALGAMLAAVGLGAALLPPLLALVIEGAGAAGGYRLLAAAAVLATLPAAFWLPRENGAVRRTPVIGRVKGLLAQARRPTGAKMIVLALLLGVFSAGVWGQAAPELAARGVSAADAAVAMAGVALVLTLTRVAAGVAMDRVFAPYVGVALLAPVVLGWLLLSRADTPSLTIAAVLLLGAGLGVEFDLFSYLTSKYVSHALYGAFYGLLYSAFSIGLACSPLIFACARQISAVPDGGFLALAGATVLAMVTLLTLPRYARLPAGHANEPAPSKGRPA